MQWLKRWFPNVASTASKRKARVQSIRPRLEILEDRRLPAVNLLLSPPTLIAPSGIAPPSPTFSWSAVSGADHYDLWLGNQTTQQVLVNGSVTGNTWTPTTPLINGDNYEWLVQAVDSSGNTGLWSAPLQFTDSNLTPPTLLAPSGSASPQPTFSWNAVTGADHYDIWVKDQTTQQVLQNTNVTGTTWTPTSSLNNGDNYIWSVQGVDSSGNPGPWSSALTFGVTNLAAPTLLGPSGAAAPQPVFSWSAVAGADHYDIWVQNQTTAQVLHNTNVAGTTWTPDNPLAQGYTYVWWVRAIDSNGNGGPWSSSLSFSEAVLPAPTLIGPSGTALPLPTFSWNAVAGADHYDIWLQDQNTSQVLRNVNVGGTTWTPSSPLIQQDNYSWWVRAVDGNGNAGQWSAGLNFVVQELSPPTPIAPSGSAATLPTFSWNAVAQASQYDIWVQDRNTGQVLRDQTVTGTTWVPTSPLNQGDNYSWWVRAIDRVGSPGPWSATSTFAVSALARPSLIAPSGSTTSPQPTFTWNTVTGASLYDIWVQDRNTGLVFRDQNVTGTSWTPASPLIRGDTFSWWVRAIDSAGSPGPWSSTMNFSIGVLPSPTLIGPVGSTSPLPTFSWSAVAGADHYDIWLQDRNTGLVVRNTNVTGASWTPGSPLLQGDLYRWWVRAVDSTGIGGTWSSSLDFSVAALAAPTLGGPSGSGSLLPTFSWSAVAGADHYDIFVRDNKTGQTLRDQNVATTTWAPAGPLTLGDSYTWWVRAIDNVNSPGPWSSSQSFTVFVLVAPTLIGPSGSTSSMPTFGWSAVTGASQYDIWVQDLHSGVVLQDATVTGTTWAPDTPLVQGDHYRWWVRAINSSGVGGAWSASLDLVVGAG